MHVFAVGKGVGLKGVPQPADSAAEVPEYAVDRDHILTDVSVYWFTSTAGSSANLYYESAHDPSAWAPKERSPVPTGVAVFTSSDWSVLQMSSAPTG